MLYKLSEWQGASGLWYCNCIDSLTTNAAKWYAPARVLGISPAELVKLVIGKFGADVISYNAESGFFHYAWTSQAKMRIYKNYINAEARKEKFQI